MATETLKTPFGYPGGKSMLAPWIIKHMPEHRGYVEPFAGSAAVLVQKPRSHSEVINDVDGDITQFFVTLRDRQEELVQWVRDTPYSRDLHRKYAGQFYDGYRPDDPVERAGRFFYLRYSQYAGKYDGRSGFCTGVKRSYANRFRNATEKLEAFAERLRHVQIENRDYRAMFNRFDEPDTLFYCDPPYVGPGDTLYRHGEFDHSAFVSALDDLEGDWMVSYERLPDGLNAQTVITRKRAQSMSKCHDDVETEGIERLALSFDPKERPLHTEHIQTRLVSDAGERQNSETTDEL